MIESIHISGVATYAADPEVLSELSKFNFVYGSNGSGKTTVSRVIANETDHPTCRVTWRRGAKLQAMVYNRDFVAKNFGPATELKGIFTLGEKNADTLAKIVTAKAELDGLTKSIEGFEETLKGADGMGGKRGELAVLEGHFKDKCWAQKKKHDVNFSSAFEGFRNNSENFKTKVLQEQASNSAALVPLVDLEEKAKMVFGNTPTVEPVIGAVSVATLIGHESNAVLKKRVLGKEDVDIAAMIKRLGNSDWVREGRSFYDANELACPFCQQSTTDAFSKSLNDYFDEAFVADSRAIDQLASDYAADAARLQQQIASIIATPSKFVDAEALRAEKELLDSRLTREPSQVVELEALGNVLSAIVDLVDAANLLVAAHNKTVANLAQERRELSSMVWKYVIGAELKSDLADYSSKKDGLKKAISAIENRIELSTKARREKSVAISELEKEATSIQPTIDGINGLLASFGFRGFTLGKAANGTCYTLKRQNGADAQETLSEGERTFVTFLYFYHLLKGSDSESGMTADRIVVFDDPVSSLDSDILFIVGSLIKGLFDEVRAGTSHIKQIFVLTHNVYFHKEVTFNPRRSNNEAMKSEETFWVVRKANLASKVERHTSNPIATSYELLWSEVRRSDRSNLAIQNTLRRILENYFKILGRIDSDEICAMFGGRERLICKSLFSWVNDGSHFAHDDLYVAIDDSMVENYLRVFREIFEKSEHRAHYKMMMGDAYVELLAPA
jgi:wobble nucleotide-excising tRNase